MDIPIQRLTDAYISEQIANQNARIQLGEIKGLDDCMTCKKPVWISCFFDGTGNNYYDDGKGLKSSGGTKYSNIAKLSQFAHPLKDEKPRIYNFYATGVGTSFNDPINGVSDSGGGIDKGTGMGFARKGQMRLDWMFSSIEAALKEQHLAKISQINISVFGFSRGAAEARGFVQQLITPKYCLKGTDELWWTKGCSLEDAPKLEIYYMGILDTVASVGIGGSRMESKAPWIVGLVAGPMGVGGWLLNDKGGHEGFAEDLSIPKYVRKCDHFIAAHEVREKFPSDSTRVGPDLPEQVNEVLYPGMHSDVGGGYAHNYQEGRTNELANIALNNLYRSAYASGVPFKSPSEVNAYAPELFNISPDLEACFKHYMELSSDGAGSRLENGVIEHMKWYYHWRWGRTLRLRTGELKPPGGVDQWMKITDQEWEEDVNDINSRPDNGKSSWFLGMPNWITGADAEVKFAATNYLRAHMKDSDRKLFDKFFDVYVHDSVAGFKSQMSDSDIGFAEKSRFTYNRFYFLGRNKDKKYIYWQYTDKPKIQEQ